ncbi:MAG: XDD4 family exosortase-dependent surface protein [Tepidisphaeraceae bacterium]
MLRLRSLGCVSCLAAIFGLVSTSPAAVIFSSTSGSLAAQAQLVVSGSGAGRQLKITLSNTSTNDVLVPADVLTALFFNVVGGTFSFTPVSGALDGGSSVVFEAPPFGGSDIGGEWVYEEGLIGVYANNPTVDRGVSTAGFAIFGPSGVFPGPDRNSQVAPDGLDYGLLSAGDNTATGNTPVTGGNPLIQSSVVLVLSVPAAFDESNIDPTNFNFQYGTALSEPFHPPEPTVMGPLGLACLMCLRRLRR